MKNWKALGSRLPLAKETPRGHHAEVEVYNARLSTKQQEVEHVPAGDINAPPTLPPRNLPPTKPEAENPGDKRSITTLGSWPLKQDNDDGRKNLSPTRKCHSLETGGKEKEKGDESNGDLDRKYEDVDPAGESIFAWSYPPTKQDDVGAFGRNLPPPLPPRKSGNIPDTCGNTTSVSSSELQHAASTELAPGHGTKMRRSSTTEQRTDKVWKKYEDVELDSSGVDVVLGSGLKRAVPDLPPPRNRDIEEHSHGRRRKMTARSTEFSRGKVLQRYENADLQSSGVNVVLGSGLKRAVPDLPPPRNRDIEEHNVPKEDKEDKDEEVAGLVHGVRDSVPSPYHLDMGDHRLVWSEHSDQSYCDTYFSQDHTYSINPNKDPTDNSTETEVYNSSQEEKCEDLEDKNVKESSSGLRKQEMDVNNEETGRRYEDVDPHGESIFALPSGLKSNEHSPRHLPKKDVHDSRPSSKKQHVEDVPAPLPDKKPSLRHHAMGGKEKEQLDGSGEEPNRKYEDTDPHGYGIFASSPETKIQCGEDTDGRDTPPPMPARNAHHLTIKDKEKDQKDEENRKYEDTDPHGNSIFASGPGSKEQCTEDTDGPNAPPPLPGRKYENVGPAGESIPGLGPGLNRAAPGQHPTARPDPRQESRSDTSRTSGDTSRDGERDAPGFCDRVRDCAKALWTKGKSSSLFWLLLGCGVVVTAAAVIAAVLGPRLMAVRTESISNTQFGAHLKHPDIDDCTRNPCQHGRCVNKDGDYKCTCSPGWTGQNCQQDKDECTRKPCQHGRCVNKDGGYRCSCYSGWTGQNCQRGQNCPSGWSEYNNHCYKLMTDKISWDKANTKCEQQGAKLASVQNEDENNFVADVIRNAKGFLRYHVWIGLKREPDGQFRWADGSLLSYTNWAPGKPDNDGFLAFGKGEGCGVMYSKLSTSNRDVHPIGCRVCPALPMVTWSSISREIPLPFWSGLSAGDVSGPGFSWVQGCRQTTMDRREFLQAARYGDVEKVRRGLEEGVDVNIKDGVSTTERRGEARSRLILNTITFASWRTLLCVTSNLIFSHSNPETSRLRKGTLLDPLMPKNPTRAVIQVLKPFLREDLLKGFKCRSVLGGYRRVPIT
uniref:C-type lectin domain-containing protein n=1 Tax=Branchiostoma floridae TaxID=7739 RepID=C3YHS1_BRAFL|eukprot:XP_002604047.1 hypothetical protein BRAFLDRAFT_71663 [Branchiostoma floridae]